DRPRPPDAAPQELRHRPRRPAEDRPARRVGRGRRPWLAADVAALPPARPAQAAPPAARRDAAEILAPPLPRPRPPGRRGAPRPRPGRRRGRPRPRPPARRRGVRRGPRGAAPGTLPPAAA